MIDYVGPLINGLERPQLPEDWDKLEPTERERANTLYLTTAITLFTLQHSHISQKTPALCSAPVPT